MIPVASPQTSSIKTEQVEASAAAALNPPNAVVTIPAKTFISLKTKSANSKTPISPRHNALTAYAKTQEVNRLTRELWDTRRVLSAAQARESSLLKELQKLTRVNLSGAADNQGMVFHGSLDPYIEYLTTCYDFFFFSSRIFKNSWRT